MSTPLTEVLHNLESLDEDDFNEMEADFVRRILTKTDFGVDTSSLTEKDTQRIMVIHNRYFTS